jgi:exodeoxyribonuclease V gamma subunit
VPHRVVCLLGLDDGVFPRQTGRDGDDIIGRHPQIGDRDARIEDRQLLLDALLAATEQLVITYAGRDERTNAERPPAVPIGELLDVIDRSVHRPDGSTEARTQVVVHHPLQPFDGRNFTAGALVADRVWSFDPVALDGARSLAQQCVETPVFLSGPLPRSRQSLVELDQLVRFAQHPVNAFLRQRLQITLGDRSDDVTDAVPIELDALEQWGVGQRLLDARLAGIAAQAAVNAEAARGLLPPGDLAGPVLDRVSPIVDGLVQASESIVGGSGEVGSSEVNVALPDGRRLVGTVAGVSDSLLRSVTYSRVGPKHRLAAWVRYLALTATHPERPLEAVTIGRDRSDAPRGCQVTVARVAAFAGDADERRTWALGHLTDLIALYDLGMCAPLPLYCQTSAAYAEGRRQGLTTILAARKAQQAWESPYNFDKEDKEQGHQLVLGGVWSFDQILAALRRDEEGGPSWPGDEPSRFGVFARRLWDGLLAVEELTDR